ncbi:MAG: hypothetical protein WAW02_04445 [Sideroxyarcus sp.]
MQRDQIQLQVCSVFLLVLSTAAIAAPATKSKGANVPNPTAAAAPKQEADSIKFSWQVETGLGYDSNVFRAHDSAYVDYAAIPTGSNPTVVPQKSSGFFVPYKARAEAEKRHDLDGKLIGSATVSGRFYAGGLSKADEFGLQLNGGSEFDLGKNGAKPKAYLGVLYVQQRKTYVDHDSGAEKTTSAGTDISNRYNYSAMGVEAEYRNKVGSFDYKVKTLYQLRDYDDPVVVSQMDHKYLMLGADVDYSLSKAIELQFSGTHSTRDYSDRHARRADGVYSSANPLLKYTYDDLGVSLRNRAMEDWVYFVDYDFSKRVDGYVNYNDYTQQRFGGRLTYGQGAIKGRASLHFWRRDYSHAYAYDIVGQPAMTYNGSDLKLKAEYAQTKALSYWAEAVIDRQISSDLRYDFDRMQIMAGVSWEQ